MNSSVLTRDPVFSIILPTHNRPEMLARSIQSVMDQTFSDYELIVIDDGSKCDNQAIVDQFPSERIQFHKNSEAQGVSAARNRAIRLARGELITFLDDDDAYLPTYLETTYNRLSSTDDSVGFSWSNVIHRYENSKSGKRIDSKTRFKKRYRFQTTQFMNILTVGTGHGMTIKSKCLRDVGLFDEAYRIGEDTDLLLRMLTKGYKPVVVPELGVIIHHHKKPRLTDLLKTREIDSSSQILKDHKPFLKTCDILWSTVYSWVASAHYELKDPKGARKALKEMLSEKPLNWTSWIAYLVIRIHYIRWIFR